MSIRDLLKQADALRAQEHEAAESAFETLAQRLASGEHVAPEDIIPVLDDARRDNESLITRVDEITDRRAKAAELEQESTFLEERTQLDAQLEEVNAQRAALETQRAELAERLGRVNSSLRRCASIRQELAATCKDPERLAEYAELRATQRTIADRIEAANRRVDQVRAELLSVEDGQQVENLNRELQQLDAELTELAERQEQTRAQKRQYRDEVLSVA